MTYVLIIMVWQSGSGMLNPRPSNLAMLSAEFNSEKACEVAGAAFVEKVSGTYTTVAYTCNPK